MITTELLTVAFQLLLLLPVIVAAWVFVRDRLDAPDAMAGTRSRLMRQLRGFQLGSNAPPFALNARKATLLKTEEDVWVPENGPTTLQAIHCYLRNGHGEYFYVLVRTADAPFGKHITHGAARAVLKDQYVAPPHEAA